MTIQLTPDGLRAIWPKAPQAIIDAIFSQRERMAAVGILETPARAAKCFANVGHECADFTIRDLTENINYTPERAAQIWPSRFKSADDVRAKYGTAAGWRLKMFDDVYGSRMGNRPGTNDGSRYIGRGGPQITGREGYREVGGRAGLPLEEHPELAAKPEHQAAIIAAFWDWKNMNPVADSGDFRAVVRRWNGGHIGLQDREARLKRILPICRAMSQSDVKTTPVKSTVAAGTAATAGGAAAAHQAGVPIEWIILGVAVAAMVGLIIWFNVSRKKG